MLRNPRHTMLALLPAMLLWAACATSGTTNKGTEANSAAGTALTVAINNDLSVPASVTVWLVGETGTAELLGTASPNGRESFPVHETIIPGTYVLRARTTAGRMYESEPFTLTRDMSSVSWDLQMNTLQT